MYQPGWRHLQNLAGYLEPWPDKQTWQGHSTENTIELHSVSHPTFFSSEKKSSNRLLHTDKFCAALPQCFPSFWIVRCGPDAAVSISFGQVDVLMQMGSESPVIRHTWRIHMTNAYPYIYIHPLITTVQLFIDHFPKCAIMQSYQCSDKVPSLKPTPKPKGKRLGASWLAASWVALPQPTPCWRAEAMHHGPDSQLSFALTVRGLAKSHFGQLFDPTLHATIPSSQHLFAVVQSHNPPHSPFGPSSKWLAIHPVATIAVVPKGQLHRGLCSLSGRLGKLHHRSRRLRYVSAYAMHMLLILLNIYIRCLSKISFVQLQIMYLFNSVYMFTSHISAFCWGLHLGVQPGPMCTPVPTGVGRYRCNSVSTTPGSSTLATTGSLDEDKRRANS